MYFDEVDIDGAVALMSQNPSVEAKIVTEICGRNAEVRLFGHSVRVIPYDRYLDIKGKQQTIGKEWKLSIVIFLFLFVLTEIYAMFRYNYFVGYDWYHLLLRVTNKVSYTIVKWGELSVRIFHEVFPFLLTAFAGQRFGDSPFRGSQEFLSSLVISIVNSR